MAEITPITLVIGFPRAGKTTLLRHLLCQPGMAGTALVAAQPDPPMWWNAGCPCCAPRDDVARALRALLPRVRRDEVRRVVIETTGLADPGPVLATLLSDTVAASAYRLDAIVTVVDAVNGMAALDGGEKAVRQIAVADRIVLSKIDRIDPSDLRARLRRLNPGAPVLTTPLGARDAAVVLGRDAAVVLGSGLFDATEGVSGEQAWLHAEAFDDADNTGRSLGSAERDAGIDAFCLSFDRPLPWPDVMVQLERLILAHGDALLRMKAILHLQGRDQPIALHSIRHLLHPPVPLVQPQGDTRRSQLMFITRDLPRDLVTVPLCGLKTSAGD